MSSYPKMAQGGLQYKSQSQCWLCKKTHFSEVYISFCQLSQRRGTKDLASVGLSEWLWIWGQGLPQNSQWQTSNGKVHQWWGRGNDGWVNPCAAVCFTVAHHRVQICCRTFFTVQISPRGTDEFENPESKNYSLISSLPTLYFPSFSFFLTSI